MTDHDAPFSPNRLHPLIASRALFAMPIELKPITGLRDIIEFVGFFLFFVAINAARSGELTNNKNKKFIRTVSVKKKKKNLKHFWEPSYCMDLNKKEKKRGRNIFANEGPGKA